MTSQGACCLLLVAAVVLKATEPSVNRNQRPDLKAIADMWGLRVF